MLEGVYLKFVFLLSKIGLIEPIRDADIGEKKNPKAPKHEGEENKLGKILAVAYPTKQSLQLTRIYRSLPISNWFVKRDMFVHQEYAFNVLSIINLSVLLTIRNFKNSTFLELNATQ